MGAPGPRIVWLECRGLNIKPGMGLADESKGGVSRRDFAPGSANGIPMPVDDAHLMVVIMAVLAGCGIFLRLVGKEKNRRERYLRQRLEDKILELKKQAEQKSDNGADPTANTIIAQPTADYKTP